MLYFQTNSLFQAADDIQMTLSCIQPYSEAKPSLAQFHPILGLAWKFLLINVNGPIIIMVLHTTLPETITRLGRFSILVDNGQCTCVGKLNKGSEIVP